MHPKVIITRNHKNDNISVKGCDYCKYISYNNIPSFPFPLLINCHDFNKEMIHWQKLWCSTIKMRNCSIIIVYSYNCLLNCLPFCQYEINFVNIYCLCCRPGLEPHKGWYQVVNKLEWEVSIISHLCR